MKDHEIGEYTDCTHGENGTRKYGCIPCAIAWHKQQAAIAHAAVNRHVKALSHLSDELWARSLAAHDKGEPKP